MMAIRVFGVLVFALSVTASAQDHRLPPGVPGSTIAALLHADPRLDVRQPFWEGRVESGVIGHFRHPAATVLVDGFHIESVGGLTPDLGLLPSFVISDAELLSRNTGLGAGPYGALHLGFSKPDTGEVRTTLAGERGHLQTRSRGMVDVQVPGARPFRIALDRRSNIALYRTNPRGVEWDGIVEPSRRSEFGWVRPTGGVEVLYLESSGSTRPGLSLDGATTVLQEREVRLVGARAVRGSVAIEAQHQIGNGSNGNSSDGGDFFEDEHLGFSVAGNSHDLLDWRGTVRRSEGHSTEDTTSITRAEVSVSQEWAQGEATSVSVNGTLGYIEEETAWSQNFLLSARHELRATDTVSFEFGRWDRPFNLFERSQGANSVTESGWRTSADWLHSRPKSWDLRLSIVEIEWNQRSPWLSPLSGSGFPDGDRERSLESIVAVDGLSWRHIHFSGGWGLGIATFQAGLSHQWTGTASWARDMDGVELGLDGFVRGNLVGADAEASTAWSARARIADDFLLRFIAEHAWSSMDHRGPAYYFDLHWVLWG